MRIIENSPALLRLRDRAWRLTVACFATASILAGAFVTGRAPPSILFGSAVWAAFALGFLRNADVAFDRTARVMTLKRFSALGSRTTRLSFADIEGVRVDTMLSDDSQTLGCRLTLATSTGDLPLSAAFEPGEERYAEMRDAILDALTRGAPRPAPEDLARALARSGRTIEATILLRQRDGLDLASARARAKAMAAEGPGDSPATSGET